MGDFQFVHKYYTNVFQFHSITRDSTWSRSNFSILDIFPYTENHCVIWVEYFEKILNTEVNISSYPATEVAGSFFFRRAEIFNSGGFVQKYSDQGVSCKNIGQ